MNIDNFEYQLQKLIHEANAAGIDIGDLYSRLHTQDVLLETLLRLEVENAYKERFK
jgi:hypothetical protein